MSNYVIVREDGAYVAEPGSPRSYTRKLEEAWTFHSVKFAKEQRCHNERVVPIKDLLRKPR